MIARAVVVVLALVAAARSTRAAEDCTKKQKASAKVHFDEGAKAFRLKELPKAAEAFKAAYDACPSPLFLYNLGQTYRQLKDNEQALYFYKQFFSASDVADQRRHEVEEFIAQLQQQIDNQRRIAEAPPPGPAIPGTTAPAPTSPAAPSTLPATTTPAAIADVPAPWYRSSLGWSLSAGGLVAVVVGVVLLAQGYDLNRQAASAPSLQAQNDLLNSSQSYTIAGGVVIGIGGAALVGGVVVFALSARAHSRAARVGVAPLSSGGAVVSLGGAF